MHEGGATVHRPHLGRLAAAATLSAVTLALAACGSATAGAGSRSSSPSHHASTHSATTSYTGLDPGAGSFYSYAPSTIQTDPTTRYVYYCQNSPSGTVTDHVYLSVGHLRHSQWQYGKPRVALAPKAGTYYSVHTCEPEVIGGNFSFGGHKEQWAMFFTAESAATNSTNQIGVAFSTSLNGPWSIDPTPIVKTSDDFGVNGNPNNCPVYTNGRTFYCLGEPTATMVDGHLILAYMGNSGSPGSDSKPVEGVVYRQLDLSNVPASGPCPNCFATLPNGGKVAAVPIAGLGKWWFHDASIAYDASSHQMVVSYDGGPPDSSPNGPPVTPVVTVATVPVQGFLKGTGSWQVQDNFGRCLSGYTDNHNTGIVRSSNGDVPNGKTITDIYTVADDNLNNDWGVWDYRLWSVDVALSAHPHGVPSITAASASCPGLDIPGTTGKVTAAGGAHSFGSTTAAKAGAPVVGMALTPDRQGYYLVTKKGHVLPFGDARMQGSVPTSTGASDVVGIALDHATGGYWVARSNGTVYAYGAPHLGNAATTSASGPVVAIASIPDGAGYYLVTANGDVTPFGHALSYGNFTVPTGQTVTAMATTPNGRGYYVVTAQGTIGTLGDATVFGPAVVATSAPIAGIAVNPDGFGYWTISATGTVTAAGDASSLSSSVDPPGKSIAGIVAS
ncbi:MAG: hypothetical protein ACRDYZ_09710 [Acidimicrobiales bacterium]